MACKDCVCYDKCLDWCEDFGVELKGTGCNFFKDKTKYKQIITCENCKHYKRNTSYLIRNGKEYCEIDDRIKQSDYFCGNAERKE